MEEWNQKEIELLLLFVVRVLEKKHIAAASIKAHLIPESGSLRGLGSRAGRAATSDCADSGIPPMLGV